MPLDKVLCKPSVIMKRMGNLIAAFFSVCKDRIVRLEGPILWPFFRKLIWNWFGAKKGNIGIVPC